MLSHPSEFEEVMRSRMSIIKTIAFFALKSENPNATDLEVDEEVQKILLRTLEHK